MRQGRALPIGVAKTKLAAESTPSNIRSVIMDLELKGKTAIITGGSRGIGKAIGREFGLEGIDVALVARGQEALEETGANFVTIVADTGDPESVKAMVKEAAEKLGRIDILVNSAARVGGAFTPKLAEITEEDF